MLPNAHETTGPAHATHGLLTRRRQARKNLKSLSAQPIFAWSALLIVAVLAGCGGSAGVGSAGNPPEETNGSSGSVSNHDGNNGAADFRFPEDEDPALSQLPYVEDELITLTYPGADPECVSSAVYDAGATPLRSAPKLQVTIVRVDPDRFLETASMLDAVPLVESVRKNYLFRAERTPDDPGLVQQTYLDGIGAAEAWDITTGSDSMVMAILDTGVAADHPDLSARLLDGWNTFEGNGDFWDVDGHGTSVAGTAAAVGNNALGIAGVTWVGKILPVRVTNTEGLASAQSVADGIVWASDHGARIANVSFAPLYADETVRRAAHYMRSAGGLVFISAGNDGTRHASEPYEAAIFVGATDSIGQLASFSSMGPFVDIAAPGVSIYTTAADGTYRTVSGTSFASPIAAGVASLVWSIHPKWRPGTVAGVLFDTAVDLGPAGRDESFGVGLIDAASAVTMARALSETDDTQNPEVRIIAPTTDSAIEDIATVEVEAYDEQGVVADVVLFVDGKPFATDAFAPYRFVVDVASLDEGWHTFTCVATDEAGNRSAPAEVRALAGEGDVGDRCVASATDSLPPETIIRFPIDGANVSGSIGIRITVTDNTALAGVALLIDGVMIESQAITGVRATVDFIWDAEDAATGQHQVAIRVTDEDGNQSETTITLNKL